MDGDDSLSVLQPTSILKEDHFPGCQSSKLSRQISGAPNFRSIEGKSFPLYGVAIPTKEGARKVLSELNSSGKRRILWHNMREEPVIFINGVPYVVREAERPFSNIELTGISHDRLERMEERLKADVIVQRYRHSGYLLLSKEAEDGTLSDVWERLANDDDVETPEEVFKSLRREGYAVDYFRLPMTDEKPPKEQDCETIAKRVLHSRRDDTILFQCQMGRGRTTTGMVIACLSFFALSGNAGSDSQREDEIEESGREEEEKRLLKGEYPVVLSLVRALKSGHEAKRQADNAIDLCDAMQNLREAIHECRNALLSEGDGSEERGSSKGYLDHVVERQVCYLDRYCSLIIFWDYLVNGFGRCSFDEWTASRPELGHIQERMLYRKPSQGLSCPPNVRRSTSEKDFMSFFLPHPEEVLDNRGGDVLSRNTFLKALPFPGSPGIEAFSGVPNLCCSQRRSLFGFRLTSTEEMVDMMRYAWRTSGLDRLCWVNVGNEPCVFICQEPYVLRLAERPYKEIREYAEMDTKRLEEMEERLRDDVRSECSEYGSVLVSHEKEDHVIVDKWRSVTEKDIETPSETIQRLDTSVEYIRLPLSRDWRYSAPVLQQLTETIGDPHSSAVILCGEIGRSRCLFTLIAGLIVKWVKCQNRTFAPDEFFREHHGRDPLRAGFFSAIIRVQTLLDFGTTSKLLVDRAADLCADIENIRERIAKELEPARLRWDGRNMNAALFGNDKFAETAVARASYRIDRYFMLITHANWLLESTSMAYTEWLSYRREIEEIRFQNWKYPSHNFSRPLPLGDGKAPAAEADKEAFVAHRSGSVLAPYAILKKLPVNVSDRGYLNLYGNLFSVRAMRVEEMDDTHSYFAQKATSDARVHFIDLREEIICFIQGTPYALRELGRPVEEMKNVGIDGNLLNSLESTLKKDILKELKESGHVLLHYEEGHSNSVSSFWLNGMDEDSVLTPHQLEERFRRSGRRMRYKRVPLSRYRPVEPTDIDGRKQRKLITQVLAQELQEVDFERDVCAFCTVSGKGSAGFAIACSLTIMRWERALDVSVSPFSSTSHTQLYNLLRVLESGPKVKPEVDAFLDISREAGNVLDERGTYLEKWKANCEEGNYESGKAMKHLARNSHKRYFLLIAFAAYLREGGRESFERWFKSRGELSHLFQNIDI